jgi:phosphoribosyl 1,2-cyclic phosphodiesterase
LKIKFYGSRASTPFFSRESIKHGGNTSCVRIDAGGHIIIIDCGSGLAQLGADIKTGGYSSSLKADILISHLHIDHIIGLSTFKPLWNNSNNIRIFTESRDERPLAEQVFGIFKPPYWPVDLSKMNLAEIIEIKMSSGAFRLNENIKVTPASACQQDNTTSFRIDSESHSLVYLLDYEIGETVPDSLVNFCKDADVVIFDAAYLPEHYPEKQGWGHSHYKAGVNLAELSKCKSMIFSHFSIDYTDNMLESPACELDGGKYYFAYDGMEFEI